MPEVKSTQNLNPLSFLERSALVYPHKHAVVYNDQAYSYAARH